MKRFFYLSIAVLALSAGACKKKTNVTPTGPDAPGSTADKIKDSIFLYAKQTYYWNDALPEYDSFSPRDVKGSSDEAAYAAEVYLLSQYKKNPATGLPFENYVPSPKTRAKYSGIDAGQTGSILAGNGVDFGFAITALSATELRVRYVYNGSAAGNANMHRGDQIIGVNNRTGLNIDLDADYSFLVSAINTSPLTMVLKRPDNTTYNVTLNSANYTINPIIITKIFDETIAGPGKKVGYMVFNSFTSPTNTRTKLETTMSNFAAAGITDLVVDLRYNGGGYVATAEILSNLIVPTAKSNTLMYNTFYTRQMVEGTADILKNQIFRASDNKLHSVAEYNYSVEGNKVDFLKNGTLNINRVFFIVTGSTASASELTINNLRPHMDVKLIGRTTYGKPVGFFAIRINKYDMYMPQFETKNSAGQGGYYTGMIPGSAEYPGVSDGDDLTKDFGDPTERLLAHAINYIKTGTYGSTLRVQATVGGRITEPKAIGDEGFNGMIFDKKLKLKN